MSASSEVKFLLYHSNNSVLFPYHLAKVRLLTRQANNCDTEQPCLLSGSLSSICRYFDHSETAEMDSQGETKTQMAQQVLKNDWAFLMQIFSLSDDDVS